MSPIIESLTKPRADDRSTLAIFVWLIILLGAIAAAWSIAAGVIYALGKPAPLPELLLRSLLSPLLGFGTLAAVGLAGAAVGGFLGFLFGLPRPGAAIAGLARETTAVDRGLGSAPAAPPPGSRYWQLSDNLLQIADWLTKIIVGVGLIEAKSLYGGLWAFFSGMGQQLFDGTLGANLMLPAITIGCTVIGFLYFNLLTQTVIAPALKHAEAELNEEDSRSLNKPEVPRIIAAQAVPQRAAMLIEAGKPPPKLTGDQRQAAQRITEVPLDGLTEPSDILAWARGQALLKRYPEAARGYRKLPPDKSSDILIEASLVYGLAGEEEKSRALNQAVQGSESASLQERVRTVSNAAITRLYEPPPAGYQRALEMLTDEVVDADKTGQLALYRAFANGQRARYEKKKAELRQAVLKDLKTALQRGQSRDWIRYIWDKNDRTKPLPPAEREDDLEVFYSDDPNDEFRQLLVPPAAGAQGSPTR